MDKRNSFRLIYPLENVKDNLSKAEAFEFSEILEGLFEIEIPFIEYCNYNTNSDIYFHYKLVFNDSHFEVKYFTNNEIHFDAAGELWEGDSNFTTNDFRTVFDSWKEKLKDVPIKQGYSEKIFYFLFLAIGFGIYFLIIIGGGCNGPSPQYYRGF
jgi:hypothetical protein